VGGLAGRSEGDDHPLQPFSSPENPRTKAGIQRTPLFKLNLRPADNLHRIS
jgi:hypothetical protein